MTIYELRDLLEHSDIADLPLRCSTYSRVSTEKETQAASLHNMTDDFRDYIERHKNWTFVKAFIDDGKSGLTTKKRKDFLNLLAAGAAGEYDLLVTGEISRFGRNTMEGLQNIQYLKDKGIPVIFLYDDLNTYDTDCDIQIQQKLVDAENESRKISKRVKRGHQKSIQKGHVLGCRMWGYKKVNCKLEIDEKTAPMVRRIFELYATNQYSMKEIEEIIRNNGLPEEISTETQLWDLIIKKATYSSPKLLFPLIYEIYGKKYPEDSSVVPLSTEYSVERSDTKEISTIKADLTFCVNESDIYHFECEITYNGMITIRMFEYDVHASLNYRPDTKNPQLLLEFPNSAVLFLQGAKKIPDYLSCLIRFQDGSTHEYRIPTVKVQSYTLEEIKEKHLCMLIPFLPIRFRRHIPSDRKMQSAKSPDKRHDLEKKVQKSKEELTSFLQETILILDQEIAEGFLTETDKKLILMLLQKSMLRISYRNRNLCQEVYNMTEPVLKLPTDELFEVIHERDALKRACSKKDSEIADRDARLADQDAKLADQDAKLAEYRRRYGDL